MNPYLEVVLRSISVYFFMIIALKVFGKKELSQLNSADIILILLISNAVQNAMVGSDTSLQGGIVAAISLFTTNFLFKKIMNNWYGLRNFIQDKPQILIHNGIADYKTLADLEISSDELHQAMREHGVDSYKEVKLAMLEIDGNISIISGDNVLRQTNHKRKARKTALNINN